MVSMDVTVVNVALPTIGRALHTGVSGLQWMIDAYTLALASFLILAGSAADRFGRRRVFQIGLALFTAGSLLCSLAPSVEWLIVFRLVQGLGGAMLNPVALSIITNTVTEPKARARAIGVWGAVVGLSMALGPIVGGTLTQAVGWRSIFWINAPVGILAIILSAVFITESKGDHARRLDPAGQSLVIVTLASLLYGLIEAPARGWTSPLTVSLFLLAAAAVVGLIVYESKRTEPLIDVRFFKSLPFVFAAIAAVVAFMSFSSFLFLNSLYLQSVLGLSPFVSGLMLLPAAVAIAVCSPVSGYIVSKLGTKIPLAAAGSAITLSALFLLMRTSSDPYWLMALAFVLFGAGIGLVNAPITNSAVSGMPRARAGAAAAITSTSRQIGTSLGVALSGTIIASVASSQRTVQLLEGSPILWWVVGAGGVALVALGLMVQSVWAKKSAERVAHLLD